MFTKILKWIGITLGSIAILLVLFYGIVYIQTENRINKLYEVKLQKLTIPSDSASLALGKHVAEIRGCLGCHGANLAKGEVFLDKNSPVGILVAANITSGKGGINYTDEDWIKALRHGLGKDNKSLWFMPSHEIAHISNQEMAALIGFLKIQPAVDEEVLKKELKPLGRLLTFLDKFPLLPAEKIDHNMAYKEEVKLAINAEYGKYLAISCTGCHGEKLTGAEAHSPDQPPIPDITSKGKLGKWTSDGFVNLFHSGITPEGRKLSKFMPVREFKYTDDELRAIYLFLHMSS